MKKQARTLSSYLGQRYAATVNVDQVEVLLAHDKHRRRRDLTSVGCGTPGIFPRRTGCSKFNGAYVFQGDYYESNKEREGLCQRNDSVRRNLEKDEEDEQRDTSGDDSGDGGGGGGDNDNDDDDYDDEDGGKCRRRVVDVGGNATEWMEGDCKQPLVEKKS
uniref:Uncharacterized protein n=1 Tax=Vespula pensylvanica TaxID=30213 RepID=A0A834NYS8_VESPE|nr:hypothetical protein H0235_009543 [Vespula pensylvanica]